MSDTIKGDPGNKEIWSARANGVGTGWKTSKTIKKRTHKIERQENKPKHDDLELLNEPIQLDLFE